MNKTVIVVLVLLALFPLVLVMPVMILAGVIAGGKAGEAAQYNPCGAGVSATLLSEELINTVTVSGFSQEQLTNAYLVMKAGKDLDLSRRDQTIGVMTALGESSLKVLDYGDTVGPDSRGLFQQRDNGAWGSYSDRMDPYISATNFFKKLKKVEQRDTMRPTLVAHEVQVNANAEHYEKFWAFAVSIVDALDGTTTAPVDVSHVWCQDMQDSTLAVGIGGWSAPAHPGISSHFGMRLHPVKNVHRLHAGTDFPGKGCGSPIYAANNGTVTVARMDRNGTGTIKIRHGEGLNTVYLHMYKSGILVKEGQQVKSGQQIGKIGNTGFSTGCHLHFEIHKNNTPIDPVPFMKAMNVSLR